MRAVWGPSFRPSLSYTRGARQHVFPRHSALEVFPCRSVTFNDAFGIFLAPFLAAATIVNLSWKEKQKKDWEQKFGEIDSEIETLRARELETWNRIQLATVGRKAALNGRRSYSTAAVALTEEAQPGSSNESLVSPDFSALASTEGAGFATLEAKIARSRKRVEPFEVITDTALDSKGLNQDVPEALWEAERIIATKLALELLVHVHIRDVDRSVEAPHDSPKNAEPSALRHPALLEQLKAVSNLQWIARRRASRHQGYISTTQSEAVTLLSQKIRELSAMHDEGDMTALQLVEGISQILVDSTEPPNIIVYTQIIEIFHRNRFDGLVPLVVAAVQRSRIRMDETAFERILIHVGQCSNAQAFDWCLKELTKVDSRLRLSQRWEWCRVAGELVPGPSSTNPRLVKTLTFAALALQQSSRAEAWASILKQDSAAGSDLADLVKAFLFYYTKTSDWDKGKFWIREVARGLQFTAGDAFRSFQHFQTMVFRMLALTVTCGKKSEYSQIMKAATEAHVSPPDLDTESYGPGVYESKQSKRGGFNNEQTKAIIFDWSWMLDKQTFDRDMTDQQRMLRFQDCLRSSDMCKEMDLLEEFMNSSRQVPFAEQQAALENIMLQLQKSKDQLQEQLQASRMLQVRLQSLLAENTEAASEKGNPTGQGDPAGADPGSEENHTALQLLRPELSQQRSIIRTMLQTKKQSAEDGVDQSIPPRGQIQRLFQKGSRTKEQQRPLPTDNEDGGLEYLNASGQSHQLRMLEQQVDALTAFIKARLDPSPQTPSLQESCSYASSTLSRDDVIKSTKPFNHHIGSKSHHDSSSSSSPNSDSDSGYCSDSSSSNDMIDYDPVDSFRKSYPDLPTHPESTTQTIRYKSRPIRHLGPTMKVYRLDLRSGGSDGDIEGVTKLEARAASTTTRDLKRKSTARSSPKTAISRTTPERDEACSSPKGEEIRNSSGPVIRYLDLPDPPLPQP